MRGVVKTRVLYMHTRAKQYTSLDLALGHTHTHTRTKDVYSHMHCKRASLSNARRALRVHST